MMIKELSAEDTAGRMKPEHHTALLLIRSEEHTSELQSRQYLHSFPTRRSSDLVLRRYLKVIYDDKGAVGRRYRRQDEAGTPYCITVDTQTLEDQTVTVRDRDSMLQERISTDNIKNYLLEKILGE